jgi:hypothetical protein
MLFAQIMSLPHDSQCKVNESNTASQSPYVVMAAQTPGVLEKIVNEMILHGWLPLGGINVASTGYYIYKQAMLNRGLVEVVKRQASEQAE